VSYTRATREVLATELAPPSNARRTPGDASAAVGTLVMPSER
jgi:hypothetical protein